MFRKASCTRCGSKVEDKQFECDFCHHKNLDNKKYCFISMLPAWKQAVIFIIGFLGFQLLALLLAFIFRQVAIVQYGVGTFQYYDFVNSYKLTSYVNFVSYLLIFATLLALIVPNSYQVFRTFKRLRPFISGIIGLLAILVINVIYTNILNICGITLYNNANENAINNIILQYPVLSILVFAFVGPVVEELTYRVGVFSFFARINKVLAYLLTVIIFTAIHFDFQTTTWINELLNIPLYASAAFVLCYIYDTQGFAGSVYCHILNNLLSIVTTIVSLNK